MTKREKEIANMMKALDLTREEAEQLWEDDNSNEVLPEVAEIEAKAEKINHHAYAAGVERKKTERKPKVDADKVALVELLYQAVAGRDDIDAHISNPNQKVEFTFNGASYTITLTKHRAAKA